MSNKIMSHELAKLLLEKPNVVVMVNGDHNACETEELSAETLEFGSVEGGEHAGGPTEAKNWVKLGQ